MDKKALIQSILQVNTISKITNEERLKKDKVRIITNEELFINLVCLSESQLTKICKELHIKTN